MLQRGGHSPNGALKFLKSHLHSSAELLEWNSKMKVTSVFKYYTPMITKSTAMEFTSNGLLV